jgi:hypothetical protein
MNDDSKFMTITNGPDPSMTIEIGSRFTVWERGLFFIETIEEQNESTGPPPEIEIKGFGFFERQGRGNIFHFSINCYNPVLRRGYLEELKEEK